MYPIIAGSRKLTGLAIVNTTINYTTNTTNIANPERGFYKMAEKFSSRTTGTISQSSMTNWRTTKSVSMILRLYYLDSFVNGSAITQVMLDYITADMVKIRAAGLKVILRFAYTDDTSDPLGAVPTDPTAAQVVAHIQQLAPIVNANKDIIVCIQQGFIGAYGENYYTTNFGNQGSYIIGQPGYNAIFQTRRNQVTQAMLDNFDSSIFILMRTTYQMYQFNGDSTPIQSIDAFNGSDKSRISHFNDGLMAEAASDGTNAGTYQNRTVDTLYVRNTGLYAPIIGETYDPNSIDQYGHSCSSAPTELRYLKYSSVHADYHLGVTGDGTDSSVTYGIWYNEGCLDEIKLNLGYRFRLSSAILPNTATNTAEVNITMINDGYTNPFHQKSTIVIFRNNTTFVEHKRTLVTDCRRWSATQSIVETVDTSAIPAGSYSLYLQIADINSSISTRPEYSVQLANTGTWNSTTGYNNLNHNITIT